jgi:hypothetical protein
VAHLAFSQSTLKSGITLFLERNPMTAVLKLLAKFAFVSSLLFAGLAMAQSEPSMTQIYSTAQAGKLDEAQVMVQQVLISHPKSAKAHFVHAEQYSRQGKLDLARQALASAEQYAPGLPFAKPEAVQALKAQLAAKPQKAALATYAAPQAPAQSSSPWVLPLVLAGGFVAAAFFFFRRRAPVPVAQPVYAPVAQNGLNGPQTFGNAGAMQPAYPQSGYPQPGYPQGAYPQQAGPGLGGRIMGGVATGLAVGAGVMAAEAIGRNLMGGSHNSNSPQTDMFSGHNNFEPIAPETNRDMGGDNFGISGTNWDDGSISAGGGSDWDN